MKNRIYYIFFWIVAGIGLILTILPPFLVFAEAIDFKFHIYLMNLGMILWFGGRILVQRVREGSS